jgi:hypothetical protein
MKGRRRQAISVNDRMQSGYRYERVVPIGRNFHPEFRPELTPKQMLELGVFCGKYMTDARKEFPTSWFTRAKLSPHSRDCSLNYFGVDASRPLAVWRKKGWIHPDDPRDGSNGNRSGAGALCAATWPKSNATANTVIRPAESARGRPSYTGPMTAERSEGLSGRQSRPRSKYPRHGKIPTLV